METGDFYDTCPKLSQEARDQVEVERSEVEALVALNACAYSAPGPDGISYSTYKKLWSNAGSLKLNS